MTPLSLALTDKWEGTLATKLLICDKTVLYNKLLTFVNANTHSWINNLLHGENLHLPTTLTSFFLREEKDIAQNAIRQMERWWAKLPDRGGRSN